MHSLRCQPKPGSSRSLPSKLSVSLKGHTKAINCIDWSPTHGQSLFLHDTASLLFCLTFIISMSMVLDLELCIGISGKWRHCAMVITPDLANWGVETGINKLVIVKKMG